MRKSAEKRENNSGSEGEAVSFSIWIFHSFTRPIIFAAFLFPFIGALLIMAFVFIFLLRFIFAPAQKLSREK